MVFRNRCACVAWLDHGASRRQSAGGRARLRCRLPMSGYWMVVLVLSLITSARVSGALGRPLRRPGVATRLNALSCLIGLAQQGARANVHIGHASCFLTLVRNEASYRKTFRSTSRARCGRGSSLTLGLSAPIRQLKSMVISVRTREVLVAAQRLG